MLLMCCDCGGIFFADPDSRFLYPDLCDLCLAEENALPEPIEPTYYPEDFR
jgi:hypothetical protein